MRLGMNTCWEILEISPTTDVDVIKTARRSLIKAWHPDIAGIEGDQELYTARCAEINAAFDRAMIFATSWRRDSSDAAAPEPRRSRVVVAFRRHPFASGSTLMITGILYFILASKPGFGLLMSVT